VLDRDGAVGEQVPQQAPLELPGRRDDRLGRLLRPLDRAEDGDDGALLL
jgi:hypothetical protein